ncbi:hypothetical protein Ancab_026120 [Ancistrocladus abbreviatus]
MLSEPVLLCYYVYTLSLSLIEMPLSTLFIRSPGLKSLNYLASSLPAFCSNMVYNVNRTNLFPLGTYLIGFFLTFLEPQDPPMLDPSYPVKLISAHQGEIRLVRTLILKTMGSVGQLLRGEVTSIQPREQRAIEDQKGAKPDTRSDPEE